MAQAQQGVTINWSSEMGCLEYDEDKLFGEEIPLESLIEGNCLTTCKGAQVEFTLNYLNLENHIK